MWIYSFSQDLQFLQDVAKFPVAPATANLVDLAIGNFAITGEPDLQLATLYQQADAARSSFVNIFTTNPAQNFALTLTDTFPLALSNVLGISLAAGDAQGRSLLLGAPRKVAVTASIQPYVILGMPPMHIDYIRDAHNLGSGGQPAIVNVSAAPSSFFSQYQTQITGQNQSSNTHTTSYTLSTKESAEAKLSYGIPDLGSIDVDVKTALTQLYQDNMSTKFNTYTGKEFDASTKTGFSDHVWYTANRFNLFIYPVIGRVGKGADGTENLPVHIQFSGPDMIQHFTIDGSLMEWYQPTWEPGNIFSYPWSLDQLNSSTRTSCH